MIFFTEPVRTRPYSLDYYPYYPVALLSARVRATRYLAKQRECAWALRYQQQPMNQPTQIALLAQEYDEFPNQQCMMHVLCTCAPQHEDEIGYIMAYKHAEMRCRALPSLRYLRRQEAQIFAHHRANAEKFLEEAETHLEDFLPPDQEPYFSIFEPFDLPDDSISTSTSKVIVQDEPLLKDVMEDCVMTEPSCGRSILGCLSADTLVQANVNEEGNTSPSEGKGKAKGIPGFEEDFVTVLLAEADGIIPDSPHGQAAGNATKMPDEATKNWDIPES
ncbi:hypothetical protein EV424DRAFT_1538367 [Suillus variegatus]|nr:hypothetical protein EV424DRAFT_1538367 [Suillus variegatus]